MRVVDDLEDCQSQDDEIQVSQDSATQDNNPTDLTPKYSPKIFSPMLLPDNPPYYPCIPGDLPTTYSGLATSFSQISDSRLHEPSHHPGLISSTGQTSGNNAGHLNQSFTPNCFGQKFVSPTYGHTPIYPYMTTTSHYLYPSISYLCHSQPSHLECHDKWNGMFSTINNSSLLPIPNVMTGQMSGRSLTPSSSGNVFCFGCNLWGNVAISSSSLTAVSTEEIT